MLKRSFYVGYSFKVFYKNKILKGLAVLLCAFSVGLSALSLCFLDSIEGSQEYRLRSLTSKEIFIINNTLMSTLGFSSNSIWDAYDVWNFSISMEEVDKIKGIPGVGQLNPFIVFSSSATNGVGFDKTFDIPVNELHSSSIAWKTASGDKKVVQFTIVEDIPYYYTIIPYRDSDVMRLQSDTWIDSSEGAYITSSLAKELGIEKELQKSEEIELTVDAWIPAIRYEAPSRFGNQSGETITVVTDHEVYIKTQIDVKLGGILRDVDDGGLYGDMNFILLPQKRMEELLEENRIEKDDLSESVYQSIEEMYGVSKKDLVVKPWMPWAYQLIVPETEKMDSIKDELVQINPNYLIVNEQQDADLVLGYMQNIQNTVSFVALSVLVIILLLMIIVQFNLLEKRKFEFALLKANGLTKREVNRLVVYDMLVTFLILFLLSVVLSVGLYYVINYFVIGLSYSWLTVLWLFLISLGAIVLPTAISLLFVNRFEPDQVMRN